MIEKTRNLSVAEYYQTIQREYLISEFRRKIYFSPKDKKYYQRVMTHKAEKINEIAERNHLDSIFTNTEYLQSIRKQLFNEIGKPTFEMTFDDVRNYYAAGNDFSYNGHIWTLRKIEGDAVVLSSDMSHEEIIVNKSEVCRIL